jgi:GNAT superfamily N-acetyltransferase
MVRIRPATATDVSTLVELIQQKAAFDRQMGSFEGVLQTTVEKLQQTLFGEIPFARACLAEAADTAVGFALYYFRYSSFQACPSLWLDDLYLQPETRRSGIGTGLMIYLAQVALQAGCSHMAWTACVHNGPGIRFYQKLGATVSDRRQHLLYFRLASDTMQSLASQILLPSCSP